MSMPVIVENDALRLEVHPQFGGKVRSIVDKADEFELLFDFPSELPTGPQYDRPYGAGYYAGWDECFPAIADGPYPGHPYDGVKVPDHGELWGLPTTAVPTRDGVTTVWHGLRFGYRLARRLWLEGASVNAEYTLVNLAPFDFRFVWALHALMSLHAPVELDMPGQIYRLSHDGEGHHIDQTLAWPRTAEGDDLSRPLALPTRCAWKVFSAEPVRSAATVRYPTRGRCLRIEYSSDDAVPAYWGIWINNGGWAGHRHFAIEPTTGRFDQLDRAVHDQSAARIAALATVHWSVRWSVG